MQNRPVTAPDDPWRGRRYLTQVQYADDSNLAARQSIYAFQRPRIDLFSWALDLAGIRGPETVLDVGCGNGNYLARLGDRQHQGLLVGLDLSVGMLTAAANRARRAGLVNGEAGSLPVASGTIGVVLAMHMLYHCPDRRSAISELGRVMRPRGTTLVVTNSREHLGELDALLTEAVREVKGGPVERIGRNASGFPLETAGSELQETFGRVELHQARSELYVTDPEAVVAYAQSMSAFLTMDGPDTADAILSRVRQRATELIAELGEIRIGTAVGCFVCREALR